MQKIFDQLILVLPVREILKQTSKCCHNEPQLLPEHQRARIWVGRESSSRLARSEFGERIFYKSDSTVLTKKVFRLSLTDKKLESFRPAQRCTSRTRAPNEIPRIDSLDHLRHQRS